MNTKLPPALEDLIQDLRDSKVLPLVALLIVAIIATPIVLAKDADPVAPAPPPGTVAEDANGFADVAVLAEQPGVRKYNQRIKGVKRSNPFIQHYLKPKGGGTDDATASGGSSSSSSVAPSPSGSSGSSGSSSSSVSVPTGGSTGGGTTSPAPAPPADPAPSEPPSDDPTTLEARATVKFGEQGTELEERKIRLGNLISRNPQVGRFLGIKGKRGYFEPAFKVAYVDSEGVCKPAPKSCYQTGLEVGQKAKFVFADEADNETVYILKLIDLDFAEVKSSSESSEG